MGITLEKFNGPGYTTNVHIFILGSRNILSFTNISLYELCSIQDFIVHWVLPLLCHFGLRNFETIQYEFCHRKFSYMINQKFMKLCTLQDPNSWSGQTDGQTDQFLYTPPHPPNYNCGGYNYISALAPYFLSIVL
jgi:hypothetical protein